MNKLDWSVPPSKATAYHGEYAVECHSKIARCMYKPIGGEWQMIGSYHPFESLETKDDALASARIDGDQHNAALAETEQ